LVIGIRQGGEIAKIAKENNDERICGDMGLYQEHEG
jgi:hypothetical protein